MAGRPEALGRYELTRRLPVIVSPRPDRREHIAARRQRGPQLGFIGLGKRFGVHVRKSVGRALRQSREHLGVQVPIFPLVLAAEHAALGGAIEPLLQLLRVDAPEELLERGPEPASEAAFCAFKSRKFSRIASTDPRRVDVVVNKRTKASSTPCEKFNGDSGPSTGGGGDIRNRLRNSLRP